MYDKNGDGHIDFREFMIVLYVMSNGTPEENLKQVNIFFRGKNYISLSIWLNKPVNKVGWPVKVEQKKYRCY